MISPYYPIILYYNINKKTIFYFADHVLLDGFNMSKFFSEIIGEKSLKPYKKPIYKPFIHEIMQYYFLIKLYKYSNEKCLPRYIDKKNQKSLEINFKINEIKNIKNKFKVSFISASLSIYCLNIFKSIVKFKKKYLTIMLPFVMYSKKRSNNMSSIIIKIKKTSNIDKLVIDIEKQINKKKYMLEPFYFLLNNRYFTFSNGRIPIDLFFSPGYQPNSKNIIKEMHFKHYAISSPINISSVTVSNKIFSTIMINTPLFDLEKFKILMDEN